MIQFEAEIERLDRVYCCCECKATFLFISDVSDHQQTSGHKQVYEILLDVAKKQS